MKKMIRILISVALLAFSLAAFAYAPAGRHAPMFENPPSWAGLFLLVAFFSLWLLPFLHHRPLPRVKSALCAAVVLFGCPFLFWAAFWSSGPALAGRIVFFMLGAIVLAGIPHYWLKYVRTRR